MSSIKLPTSAGLILLGYFAFFPVAFACFFIGVRMHTDASMISGALLGTYIALFCPQIWLHIVAYPKQIYKVEWLFIAIALTPIPVWLYTMFFVHSIGNSLAWLVLLPVITLSLGMRLPSPKNPQERVAVWNRSSTKAC